MCYDVFIGKFRGYFDENLINNFRERVNENYFVLHIYKNVNGKNKWNCICSAMDWISVSVHYLCSERVLHLSKDENMTTNIPFTEEKKIFCNNQFSMDDNNFFKTVRACFGAHPVNLYDTFNVDVLKKIKKQIANAQYQVLTVANMEKNILYWNIGQVILEYSKWGNKFVENLSKDLRMEYPGTQGYSVRNLNYMKQFASRDSSEEILHQVGAKINWRTIKALIDKTNTIEEYVWYAEQCLENGWSSTVLVHQVESKLYERQADERGGA